MIMPWVERIQYPFTTLKTNFEPDDLQKRHPQISLFDEVPHAPDPYQAAWRVFDKKAVKRVKQPEFLEAMMLGWVTPRVKARLLEILQNMSTILIPGWLMLVEVVEVISVTSNIFLNPFQGPTGIVLVMFCPLELVISHCQIMASRNPNVHLTLLKLSCSCWVQLAFSLPRIRIPSGKQTLAVDNSPLYNIR